MHPGYGGEIQHFLVEGCTSSSLFPASAAANASSDTALRHTHLQHQNQQQTHFPLHFQPMPMTQQLFHQTHYFQLFSHPAAAAAAAQPPPHQEMGLDLESGPENSASFLTAAAVSFKLGVNESSGGGSREGLNDDEAILHGDDGSESHVHPWQREEESAIKEPFWRPLDIDYINRNNKRCKEKQLEAPPAKYCKKIKEGDEQEHGNTSGTSNYKLFSELEAIYKPGSNASGANPTGSSSVLTGENPLLTPAPPGQPSEQHANHGSDTTTGEEVPVKKYSKTTGGSSSSSRRKRKRRQQQLSSVAAFFETLVKQLMEHQEGLHRKFLEVMERRDRERATREEAWRRQDAAKSNREAAARAQERALTAARETAIISFLEKISGESINLPSNPQFPLELIQEMSQKEENSDTNPLGHSEGFLNNNVADMSNNSINNNNHSNNNNNLTQMNSSRWPKAEVQALIRVRSLLEYRFQEPGLKGPLWEEVSSAMAAMGYSRSAKRCKEKWENINKYFRKTKESGKKRPAHSKTCPYFHQLDQLYSKSTHKLPRAAASDASGIPRKDNSELLDAIVVPSDHPSFEFSEMPPMRFDFNRSGNDDDPDAAGRDDHDDRDGEDEEVVEEEEEEEEGNEDGVKGGGEAQGKSHLNGHEGFHKAHDPTFFFQRLES